MNRRKGAPLSSTFAPQVDTLTPATPSSPSNPRSPSPSSGFAQFLSKPKTWFGRSSSGSKLPSPSAESRPSNASIGSARKHKISRPTDPRPILDTYGVGSKSVFDLSQPQVDHSFHPPSVPSSPITSHTTHPALSSSPSGLGDLRSLSRKTWSRSADDLNQISATSLSTLNTSFQGKITQYRNRNESNASMATPLSSPTSSSAATSNMRHPFPRLQSDSPVRTVPQLGMPPRPDARPPRSATLPTVSISVSAPMIDESIESNESTSTHGSGTSAAKPQAPTLVHKRSQSFTLTPQKQPNNHRFVPSPRRKGSGSVEKEPEDQYSQQVSETRVESPFHGQPMTPMRAAFAHHGTVPTTKSVFSPIPKQQHRAMNLRPPTIIEPGQNHSSALSRPDDALKPRNARRTSQIVFHSGFINRLADTPASSIPFHLHYNSSGAGPGPGTLAKGWKAYKMELKGTKLFFYKPPSDRNAGIKELFPTGLVPPSLEDDDDGQEGGEGGKDVIVIGSDPFAAGANTMLDVEANGKGREEAAGFGGGRKRRAFWGRRAHPDLVRDMQSGKLEKGTFEALAHEAVFATTFFKHDYEEDVDEERSITVDSHQQIPSSHDSEREKEKEMIAWKSFASTIVLSLPSIVGRQNFENEFIRCCGYFVNGLEEDGEKDRDMRRVGWLVDEYLKYHGTPVVGEEKWEKWRKEIIPDIPGGSALSSPVLDESPNVGAFSPRPTKEGPVSLTISLQLDPEAKSGPSPTSQRPGPSPSPPATRVPWVQLQEEGLTREVLSIFDPYFIAKSLTLFHRSILEAVPKKVTSEYVLLPHDDDEHGDTGTGRVLKPIFGHDDRPNWLTKLILLQIMGQDMSNNKPNRQEQTTYLPHHPHYGHPHHHGQHHLQSPHRMYDDKHNLAQAQAQSLAAVGLLSSSTSTMTAPAMTPTVTSKTHSRSEIISFWAKVGEICWKNGDECSWKAILEALCSRPVARLEKVWKRVDPLALNVIESWVYPPQQQPSFTSPFGATSAVVNGGGSLMKVKEPRVTAWGGDVCMKVNEELGKMKDDQMLSVDVLHRVKASFDRIRGLLESCPREFIVDEENGGEAVFSDDMKRMVAFWRQMADEKDSSASSLAMKFQRVDQFMSLSLAAEPRRHVLLEPHFWSKAPPSGMSSAPHASLVPLLFPEALPTVTLIDRSQLVRGRVDSDASDFHFMRGVDPQLRILQRSVQNENEVTKKSIMGTGGTVISLYNGELYLVVQPGGMEPNSRPSSRAPSRPPSSVVVDTGFASPGLGEMNVSKPQTISRAPSIRVKPNTSQGLERKASMAKRNSLPSLSHRQNYVISERSSDPPLRVLVQAGTLNALVNILVHGLRNVSVSVADDNGEMTLREGMTRDLVVDRAEFARVWWNVFRSFLTPMVFFELLRKMYITTQPSGSSPSVNDYLEVLASRTRVLELVSDWLTTGGGAQDVLDEPQLYTALKSFLNTTADHVLFKTETFEEPDVSMAWVTTMNSKAALQEVFDSQMKRPIGQKLSPAMLRRGSGATISGLMSNSTSGGRMRGMSVRELPELDGMNAEDLVEMIDGMARAALSNVTEEDLYTTAELLELQTYDRVGWFSPREFGTVDEVIEIQTMYTHIHEVEPSTLISEMTAENLYRLLPPGIRSCIRAHGIIRKWLISKLVVPKLGLRTRQTRMELFLRAIEVARLRNAEANSSHHIERPCVRSFVEAVICSAIMSVESRLHQRPWQLIAYNRGCTCDSLAALLARPSLQSTSSMDCLTVDMGWLIERMLEVIASSDLVESSGQEGQNIVNFDKRRHLCNLISRTSSLPNVRKVLQSEDATLRGFERLNAVEKEVLYLQFDHRGIREESTREAVGVNVPSSIKKVAKPFQKLVAFQMEKNRRDRIMRAKLLKERQQEQFRIDRREDMISKAMRPRKQPTSTLQKQHRNKKSMSAFLNFMRPISSAFGADLSVSSAGVKRTPEELDFPTTGKPSLVLSVMDAKVAQFINNERSFTFQLDTEDGGHYILQAMSKKDMTKWLETINKVTSTVAKRRLTYLGPKPQIQDHIHEQPAAASKDPHAVFGIGLESLLQRQAGVPIPPGTIPLVIDQCLTEVELRGLTEVGIYRIAGAVSEINSLKDAYNRGEHPITKITDIHAVCDLVKTWFRVLPEPVFPPSSYHDIMDAMKIENLENRLTAIRTVVQSLPQPNFDLLKRVSEHLDRVTDYEEHNHMTAEALAIVFSPNLLRAPQNDFVTILNNMGQSHKLVKALITHFHNIFDEVDPEAEEAPSEEDDMESPILEEDEDEGEDQNPPTEAAESRDHLRSMN